MAVSHPLTPLVMLFTEVQKMVKVICEIEKCIYYVHKPQDGEAYQHQCGNDEIEIGAYSGILDKPVCFSFEEA